MSEQRLGHSEPSNKPFILDPSLPSAELDKQYRERMDAFEERRIGSEIDQIRAFQQVRIELFEPAFKIDALKQKVLGSINYIAEGHGGAHDLALAFLEDHIFSIAAILATPDSSREFGGNAYESVFNMLGANARMQLQALEVFHNNLDNIFNLNRFNILSGLLGHSLAKVAESSNPALTTSVHELMQKIIDRRFDWNSHNQDLPSGAAFLGGLLVDEKRFPKAYKYGQGVLYGMLGHAELDPEATVRAWEMGRYLEKAVADNLPPLAKLDHDYQGSVRLLSQDYHLFNYGRYPQGILEDMAATHEDNSQPVFYVVYPRSDDEIWGQFYNDRQILAKLYAQLKGKARIKIIEVETTGELEQMLDSIRERFGEGRSGILAGHGSKDAITIGKEGEGHQITSAHFSKENINHGVARALKQAFVPGATLGFFSCSTGFDDPEGIARVMHETTGLATIGPDRPTSVWDINAEVDESGNVNLDIDYYKANSIKRGGTR